MDYDHPPDADIYMKTAAHADARVPFLLSYDIAFALISRVGTVEFASPASIRTLGDPAGEGIGDPLGAWPQLCAMVRNAGHAPSPMASTVDIAGRYRGCRIAVHLPDVRLGQVLPLVILHPFGVEHSPDLEGFDLTPREREVARLLAAGLAIKQVAGRLGVSYHTARHHAERVYTKLGVHGRVEVARLVMGAA